MTAVVLRKLRSTIALALMLWCAGAGCVVVSYARGASMTADMSVKQTDASASVASHAGCQAHHSSSKIGAGASPSRSGLESFTGFLHVALPNVPGPSGGTSCCPLTSGSFVTTSRAESNGDNASTAGQSDSLSAIFTDSPAAPRAFPLRLRDQNQTYLRGCVFLI